MPLIDRFMRLFTADLHAVLDRLEEPEVVLRQALRDMEDELAAMQGRAAADARAAAALATSLAQGEAALARLDDDLGLAIDAGQDTLARSLVRRRLETEQRLDALRTRGAALDGQMRSDAAVVAAAQARVEELRGAIAGLPPVPGDAQAAPPPRPIADDLVEAALLRERARRGHA